jgi:hypothetical protein
MGHPQTIFTLPEQRLEPREDRLADERAEHFECKVQDFMNYMDSADTALAIYENNPINDGCLEILAMAIEFAKDGTAIDTTRVKVLAEHAKRLFAEDAVERMYGLLRSR